MNAGATSDRVYQALKDRLLDAALLPGEKLEPARLAADLLSSVTPVRDALHRLQGERLVETRSSEGFFVPHMTEPAFRNLHASHLALLRGLARQWSQAQPIVRADEMPADIGTATRRFFELFAKRSENSEALLMIDGLADRLGSVRKAERLVLKDREIELRDLATSYDQESTAMIVRRIDAYHRRRLQSAAEIVQALYQPR